MTRPACPKCHAPMPWSGRQQCRNCLWPYEAPKPFTRGRFWRPTGGRKYGLAVVPNVDLRAVRMADAARLVIGARDDGYMRDYVDSDDFEGDLRADETCLTCGWRGGSHSRDEECPSGPASIIQEGDVDFEDDDKFTPSDTYESERDEYERAVATESGLTGAELDEAVNAERVRGATKPNTTPAWSLPTFSFNGVEAPGCAWVKRAVNEGIERIDIGGPPCRHCGKLMRNGGTLMTNDASPRHNGIWCDECMLEATGGKFPVIDGVDGVSRGLAPTHSADPFTTATGAALRMHADRHGVSYLVDDTDEQVRNSIVRKLKGEVGRVVLGRTYATQADLTEVYGDLLAMPYDATLSFEVVRDVEAGQLVTTKDVKPAPVKHISVGFVRPLTLGCRLRRPDGLEVTIVNLGANGRNVQFQVKGDQSHSTLFGYVVDFRKLGYRHADGSEIANAARPVCTGDVAPVQC